MCVSLLEIRLRAIYSVKCVADGNSTRKHVERGVIRVGRDKMLIKLCKSGKNLCCAARGC